MEREKEATINGLDCCGFERKNNHFAGWLIEMGKEEGEKESRWGRSSVPIFVDVRLINFMG